MPSEPGIDSGEDATSTSGAVTSSTSGGNDHDGSDDTGEPPIDACRGDLPGGGPSSALAGTGVQITDTVALGESITLDDVGASLTITPTSPPGEPDSADVSVTLTSLTEVAPAALHALGPVFEVAIGTGSSQCLSAAGTPIPSAVGTCTPAVWTDRGGSNWLNLDLFAAQAGSAELCMPMPSRFVVASWCSDYTCDGACASPTADDHCGGCDLSCQDALCIAPGVCAGSELGASDGPELRSDGEHAFWIPADQRGVRAVGPATAPLPISDDVAILDIDLSDGFVYWLELDSRSWDPVPPFAWALRRSIVGGPAETLFARTDPCCTTIHPIRLTVEGGEIYVLAFGAVSGTARLRRLLSTDVAPQLLDDDFDVTLPQLESAWSTPRLRSADGFLYMLQPGLVKRLDLSTGDVHGTQVPGTENGRGPTFIELEGPHLYAAKPGGEVFRVTPTGTGPVSFGETVGAFAVRGGAVTFGHAGSSGEIEIVEVDAAQRSRVLVQDERPAGITWVGDSLVWTTWGRDGLLRSYAPR